MNSTAPPSACPGWRSRAVAEERAPARSATVAAPAVPEETLRCHETARINSPSVLTKREGGPDPVRALLLPSEGQRERSARTRGPPVGRATRVRTVRTAMGRSTASASFLVMELPAALAFPDKAEAVEQGRPSFGMWPRSPIPRRTRTTVCRLGSSSVQQAEVVVLAGVEAFQEPLERAAVRVSAFSSSTARSPSGEARASNRRKAARGEREPWGRWARQAERVESARRQSRVGAALLVGVGVMAGRRA
jgi:hypothetical protein